MLNLRTAKPFVKAITHFAFKDDSIVGKKYLKLKSLSFGWLCVFNLA